MERDVNRVHITRMDAMSKECRRIRGEGKEAAHVNGDKIGIQFVSWKSCVKDAECLLPLRTRTLTSARPTSMRQVPARHATH